MVRIASYNVHSCRGRDGVYAPERIARILEAIDADVIALQELGPTAGDTFNSDALTVLKDHLGGFAVRAATQQHASGAYGNAVLSRYPILSSQNLDLSYPGREPRLAMQCEVEVPGGPLRVVATHLGLSRRERRQQVERLLRALDGVEPPVVLLGDLNEWWPASRPLVWLRERFGPSPAPATFPTRRPVFAIDRIMADPHGALRRVRVHDTPEARSSSDHLPVVAELTLETGA